MEISRAKFKSEVKRWRQKWSEMNGNVTPKTLVETIDHGNRQFYQGSYAAVITLLTYPVSTCTAERSFNSVKSFLNTLTKYQDQREIELYSNFVTTKWHICKTICGIAFKISDDCFTRWVTQGYSVCVLPGLKYLYSRFLPSEYSFEVFLKQF